MLKLAAGSIAVSLVVLGLKYLAYALTGSVALYSDAIESIINVVTAIAAFFAIRISLRPADADHPYGHSKAEYFSAVLEGVLILVASLAILREAYGAFLNPHALQAPALGLAVSAAATALNGAWSWLLITTGRKRRSPALIADGKHLLTDVVTSGGVIVGVLLVALTGWEILDPILAALVALNILWSGWSLIKESIGGLMDTALPTDELAAVQATINANMAGALEAHDLRSRHAGRMTFIDFHLVVDGAMTVDTSHAICDRIEAALKADHPDSIISIHVEPEAKRKHGAMAIA
ncbi:cadmium transporter [Sphingomonas sp. Leaf242]|nr:cadmium transporter [Sphingomonas sp. Leaf242]